MNSNTPFIRVIEEDEAVKELKGLHNDIKNDSNVENNLQWSVEPSSRKVRSKIR